MNYPNLILLRQRFERTGPDDLRTAVRDELVSLRLDRVVRAGQSVVLPRRQSGHCESSTDCPDDCRTFYRTRREAVYRASDGLAWRGECNWPTGRLEIVRHHRGDSRLSDSFEL